MQSIDRLKDFYENWALSHEWLFILVWTIVPTCGTLIVSGFGAWVAFSNIRDSRGNIVGKVSLEDGNAPSEVKIRFFQNGDLKTSTSPNQDGDYSLSLKNGNYAIEVSAPGYNSQKIPTVTTSSGTFEAKKIVLSVSPKPVKIIVTDRAGYPYKLLNLVLVKKGTSTEAYQYKTDDRGAFKTRTLNFGEYYPEPLTVNSTEPILRTTGMNSHCGTFKLEGGKDVYSLVLPRIVFSNLTGLNSAPTFKPTTEKFFAESVTLTKRVTFSGIGIGIGLNGIGMPSKLQIRRDAGGIPSDQQLFLLDTSPSQAAITSTSEGAFSQFTSNGSTRTLEPGTYWVVAQYDQTPLQISALAGNYRGDGFVSIKSSEDGINWKNDTVFGESSLIDVFFSE